MFLGPVLCSSYYTRSWHQSVGYLQYDLQKALPECMYSLFDATLLSKAHMYVFPIIWSARLTYFTIKLQNFVLRPRQWQLPEPQGI